MKCASALASHAGEPASASLALRIEVRDHVHHLRPLVIRDEPRAEDLAVVEGGGIDRDGNGGRIVGVGDIPGVDDGLEVRLLCRSFRIDGEAHLAPHRERREERRDRADRANGHVEVRPHRRDEERVAGIPRADGLQRQCGGRAGLDQASLLVVEEEVERGLSARPSKLPLKRASSPCE